jgi:phage terminase large subunit-like protein
MMMMNCNEYLREYIDIVEQGKIRTCKEQKLLVALVKKALQEEDLKVDDIRIEKYMSYQKYFPFELFAWEKFVFICHNCIFKKDGTPRWSDLFVLMGRGGGKNGYLSFEDFCLITETNGVAYYDIDICANSEEQARTSFDEIYNILENPKWRKKFEKNFRWTKTEIQNKKTRSKIKYRTNNPKGKDGLRSGKVDFDEPHAYENWENINVFTTGLGKKPHPRRTYVSTNGDVREGPLDQLIEKSLKILNGEIDDNGFLPFICKLDDAEEVHDSDNWEKANPSLPYLPTLKDQMKREYQDYLLDPVINNSFMTKRMNIPQGRKDTEVASWENIMKTNGEVPDLRGCTCVCGIDFSKTTDFMSAFLLFKKDEKYYGIHHSWFCTNSNDRYRIKIPLKDMVQKGLLTMVDDVEINPSLIADWIYEKGQIYNIEKIAIDNYRYSLLSRALNEVGYDAKEKQVKLVRPSDIMLIQPTINSMFVSNKLIVGDDPLFRWFVNNTKLEPAPNNNFKYGKIEPKSRKTDGFMAFVAAMTIEEELPEVQEMGFFETIIL